MSGEKERDEYGRRKDIPVSAYFLENQPVGGLTPAQVEARYDTWRAKKFYALRRTDGKPVDGGEIEWFTVTGPNDWCPADEYGHDEPTEYEIVEMHVVPVAKRTFGEIEHNNVDGECDYCGESFPCEWLRENP